MSKLHPPNIELMELRNDIIQIKRNQELILQLLSPKTFTIAFISKTTGKSRQAIRDWLWLLFPSKFYQ